MIPLSVLQTIGLRLSGIYRRAMTMILARMAWGSGRTCRTEEDGEGEGEGAGAGAGTESSESIDRDPQ